MSAHNPPRAIGSFFSNPIRRALILAAIGFVGIGLIGCQSAKNDCASCPFSRNKEKIDDIEERGQEASATSTNNANEPTAPNVSQTVEPLDRGLFGARLFKRSKTRAPSPTQVESDSSLPAVVETSKPTPSSPNATSEKTAVVSDSPQTFDSPTQSEALASAASALNQHFPNTAADVKKDDPVEIPEAPAASVESSQDAPATTPPQYQSVGPSDSSTPDQQLGFAPSEFDHSASSSASSSESTQDAPSDGPVLSDVSSPKDEAQPESAENPDTPSSAPVQDASTPVEGLQASSTSPVAIPDQSALQATFASKPPVSLKTSTTPRYVYNTVSTSTRPTEIGAPRSRVAKSAVNARSSNAVGEASRFVPNGQTSQIIPGKQLGVIEISSQKK